MTIEEHSILTQPFSAFTNAARIHLRREPSQKRSTCSSKRGPVGVIRHICRNISVADPSSSVPISAVLLLPSRTCRCTVEKQHLQCIFPLLRLPGARRYCVLVMTVQADFPLIIGGVTSSRRITLWKPTSEFPVVPLGAVTIKWASSRISPSESSCGHGLLQRRPNLTGRRFDPGSYFSRLYCQYSVDLADIMLFAYAAICKWVPY